MLTVKLQGGLGNQLFQLAAVETIAYETDRKVYLLAKNTPPSAHSAADYFSTIFSKFNEYPIVDQSYAIAQEPSYVKQNWNSLLPEGPVCLQGYFQNWRYVSPDFMDKLTFPHCPLLDGAFIHIRGGDYVNHWLHHVDLTSYYENAIQRFPSTTHFYIFTNDINYAKTFSFLSKIQHTFVNEDEVMSLTMMSKCAKGGICANSTFSWWGAYLNPNRTIVIPSKWSHDISIVQEEGYFFPGTISLDGNLYYDIMKFNSQAYQDLFILACLKSKRNGSFLEIGSNDPIKINNTYLLESEFGWSGIMVEYDANFLDSYKKIRPNSHHIIKDATKIDYLSELQSRNIVGSLDYLQIDLEVDNRSTIDTLILLDNTVFDTYKFAVVTFEHDIYRGDYFETRRISREIFNKRGYICVFKDVEHEDNAFEDWYVHPDLVDMNHINTFLSTNDKNPVNDIRKTLQSVLEQN